MGVQWDDVYTPQPAEAPDEGVQRLLAIVPEDRRSVAEPLLSGWLAMVRSELREAEYQAFVADMASAAEAHLAGNDEKARSLLGAYGIDYSLLVGVVG